MQIGHELLTAATQPNSDKSTVSVAERRTWFGNAARMFLAHPDSAAIAAR